MTKSDLKSKAFVAEAVIPISNAGGIQIMVDHRNDCVHYRFAYGQDLRSETIFEAEIVTSREGNGELGFYHGKEFHAFSEAFKIK